MSFSINTNGASLTALENLSATNVQLNTTMAHINTGMKVSSAKDNAAVYAIAQNLRANVAGLSAVTQSLNTASSATDVALAAGQAVSDLLTQMKAKAVAAKDPGATAATRTALNNDFVQLRDQITTIVDNASFNGINAVKNGGSAITAITNDTGSSTIKIAAQDLSLTGSKWLLRPGRRLRHRRWLPASLQRSPPLSTTSTRPCRFWVRGLPVFRCRRLLLAS